MTLHKLPKNRRLPEGLDELPSGRIRARYRDEDGTQYSRSFPTVRAAKDWRMAQMVANDRGEHVAPSRITVVDYAKQYVDGRSHRASTSKTMQMYLRALEADAIGRLLIARILPSHIDAWRKRLEDKYARTSVLNRYGWLRSVFSAAVEDRMIARSPFTSRTRPNNRSSNPHRIVPMTVQDVQLLTDAMPERYRD